MARITTCVLRIAATAKSTNLRLQIAAQVFTNAGVILLYIVNLIFVQRLLRAQHPKFGWSRPISYIFRALYVLIVITITMLITVIVQAQYTLSINTHRIDRDIQLYGITTFTILSFLPIPIMGLMYLVPRRPTGRRPDKFGEGRWREKIAILLTSSTLLTLGAAYRCGVLWKQPVPRTEPLPAYFSKGAFYVVYFTIEVLVVFLYAVVRVDLRFWVPNGASKRRHFRTPDEEPKAEDFGAPATESTTKESRQSELPEDDAEFRGVFSEEETFDENSEGVYIAGDEEKHDKELEAGARV